MRIWNDAWTKTHSRIISYRVFSPVLSIKLLRPSQMKCRPRRPIKSSITSNCAWLNPGKHSSSHHPPGSVSEALNRLGWREPHSMSSIRNNSTVCNVCLCIIRVCVRERKPLVSQALLYLPNRTFSHGTVKAFGYARFKNKTFFLWGILKLYFSTQSGIL